jgi:hypothetical protein
MKYRVSALDSGFAITVTHGSAKVDNWASYGLGQLFYSVLRRRKYPRTEQELIKAIATVEAYCAKHNARQQAYERVLARVTG